MAPVFRSAAPLPVLGDGLFWQDLEMWKHRDAQPAIRSGRLPDLRSAFPPRAKRRVRSTAHSEQWRERSYPSGRRRVDLGRTVGTMSRRVADPPNDIQRRPAPDAMLMRAPCSILQSSVTSADRPPSPPGNVAIRELPLVFASAFAPKSREHTPDILADTYGERKVAEVDGFENPILAEPQEVASVIPEAGVKQWRRPAVSGGFETSLPGRGFLPRKAAAPECPVCRTQQRRPALMSADAAG